MSNAAELLGTVVVVVVSDGDTITVLTQAKKQHKIRLLGIDAPKKKQAFGQRSKQSLSDLIYKKQVTVETDKQDRYGRDLGKVLANDKDANLMQIERGLAWWFRTYKRDQSADDRLLYEADSDPDALRGSAAPDQHIPAWMTRSRCLCQAIFERARPHKQLC